MRSFLTVFFLVFAILSLATEVNPEEAVEKLGKLGILNPEEFSGDSTVTGYEMAMRLYLLYEDLSSKIKGLMTEMEKLFNPLSEKLDRVSVSLNGLEKKMEFYERKLEDEGKQIEQFRSELSELKSQIHELFSKLSELEEFGNVDLEGLVKTQRQLDVRVGILEGKMVESSESVKDLESGLEKLSKRMEALKGILEGEIADMKSEVLNLSKRLEETSGGFDKRISELERRIETLEGIQSKLGDMLKTISSNEEYLYKAVKANQGSIENLGKDLAKVEKGMAKYEKSLESLETLNWMVWISLGLAVLGLVVSVIALFR